MAPHIALHEIGVPFTPRQGQEHANGIWAMAEQRLARVPGPWALGAYSIADIHLFRLYWRFAASRGPEPARFPALQAHHDRMLNRPAVQRTIAIEADIGYERSGFPPQKRKGPAGGGQRSPYSGPSREAGG